MAVESQPIADGAAAIQPGPPATIVLQQQSQESLPAPPLIKLPEKPTLQLEDFGCTFDQLLGYVLYRHHEVLIPASKLQDHLFQKHEGNFPAHGDRGLVVKNILLSLTALYGLNRSQKYPGPGWESLYPIHKRVYTRKCCSLCPTFFYVQHIRQYSSHFLSHHKGLTKVEWSKLQFFNNLHQPFETQALYLIPNQSSSQLASSVTASVAELESSTPPLQDALDFPPPQFCQELGFLSWVEPLGQHQAVLNYLTATPGTIATKNTSGKKAQLEETLLQVHICLDTYLSSGQDWLFVYHSRLYEKGMTSVWPPENF